MGVGAEKKEPSVWTLTWRHLEDGELHQPHGSNPLKPVCTFVHVHLSCGWQSCNTEPCLCHRPSCFITVSVVLMFSFVLSLCQVKTPAQPFKDASSTSVIKHSESNCLFSPFKCITTTAVMGNGYKWVIATTQASNTGDCAKIAKHTQRQQ